MFLFGPGVWHGGQDRHLSCGEKAGERGFMSLQDEAKTQEVDKTREDAWLGVSEGQGSQYEVSNSDAKI